MFRVLFVPRWRLCLLRNRRQLLIQRMGEANRSCSIRIVAT